MAGVHSDALTHTALNPAIVVGSNPRASGRDAQMNNENLLYMSAYFVLHVTSLLVLPK